MPAGDWPDNRTETRSEEHTSELQSRRDLVCRLLLEKNRTAKVISGCWAASKKSEGRTCLSRLAWPLSREVATRVRVPVSEPSASFFFNDTATTEIYTLSLHDALPILCWSPKAKPTSFSPIAPVHSRRRR